MLEIKGNIWDFHKDKNWIVVTTNGSLGKDGRCIMGKGVALDANNKFPLLPKKLGNRIMEFGNNLFWWPEEKIITFPVKHEWYKKADLNLIEKSCSQLLAIFKYGLFEGNIYLVRPGCGNGALDWKEVKPVLGKYLIDDRFIVVNKE